MSDETFRVPVSRDDGVTWDELEGTQTPVNELGGSSMVVRIPAGYMPPSGKLRIILRREIKGKTDGLLS